MPPDIARLTPEGALARLDADAGGLTEDEARRRLARVGPNRVEAAAQQSLALRLLNEFVHFFALILWVAAGLAFVAEAYDPGQGMRELGFAIVGVIVVNGVFSFWQEYRAEQALAALRSLLPQQVQVLRAGRPATVEAETLVPGDLILVAEGDKVPADCRLLEAHGLRVNTATVTGESAAVPRGAEPCAETHPLAASNLLLAGTLVVGGSGRALVFATGMHTEFGRIAHLTQAAGETASPLQREIARVSRLVALLASGLGVVFFFVGQAIGLPFMANLMFAIGIIVANVPEGLLPTVTLALALATQRMARRNVLVRHLPAVEALGSTTVICSDKTGTLTQNRMAVRRVWNAGAWQEPAAPASDALYAIARHCHELRPAADGTLHGDPMELALVEWATPAGSAAGPVEHPDAFTFDTERKRMSVIVAAGDGRQLLCKGAPETVLPLCTHADAGAGLLQPLDAAGRAALVRAQETMADAGLRVLALAWRAFAATAAPAESGLVLAGLIGLEDPPRPDVAEAVTRCHAAGVRVIMVTGDHPHTALAIAREIGLVRGRRPTVLRGTDIARCTPAQLQQALAPAEVVCARVTAEQKLLVVEALQRRGEVVAVTGDGVNDAPALKRADIGIAMGRTGTDVAKEAADLVLLDDHFASIVNAIEEGRAVYENIRKFLTYILSSNIPEIVPYLAFVLLRIPLPLTIIQILAVDLGTDMLPALALGAERPHAGLMRVPPRPRHERLLNLPLLARAYGFLGVLEAAVALGTYALVLHGAGWQWGAALAAHDPLYRQATTACLAAIVVTQMANLFLCRHPREPAHRFGLGGNRLLPLGLATELLAILAIVYTDLGNRLFGTAPLPAAVWGHAALGALAMYALEEGRKAWVRRRPG
ncbi:cation-translocating P-type ATPase [Plasticicumulans lactativorans]|nr:cation-transporting P-type ATPase [Plasticicumulans lactativorans]